MPESAPKLLQLTADLAVQPRKVAAIKRSSLDEDSCVVFMSGQSATDGGFVVERAFEDVVDEVDAALAGEDLSEPSEPSGPPDPDASPDDLEDEGD